MKKIFYIATIALFGLASCSKEVLNPVPSNAVSDTQIFSSVASAETALNGGIKYIGYYLTNPQKVPRGPAPGQIWNCN